MKKFISLLISAVMVLSVFTSLPATSFAAKKKASKVSLKKSSVTLKITKTDKKTTYGKTSIKVKKAKGVKVKKITYKSSNKKIASVNKKGVVKAKKKGAANVKVKVKYTFKKRSYKKTLTFKVKVKYLVALIGEPATYVPEETTASLPTEPVESTTSAQPSEAEAPTDAAETTSNTEGTSPTDKPDTTDSDYTYPTNNTGEYPTGAIAPTGGDYYPTYSENDTGHCTDQDNMGQGVTDPDWTGVTKPDGSPYYEYYTSQPETSGDVWGDTGHCTDQDNMGQGVTDPDWTGVTKPDGSPYYDYYETEPAATEPATEELDFDDKLSAFSNKLYNLCSKNVKDNYVMSPVSVYMALSMLYYSGDDGVKNDIKDFVEMNDSDLKKTGELFNRLNVEYGQYDWEKDEEVLISKLSLSNSVWFDDNVKMDEEAVKQLADDLYCEAKTTPFKDDNITANKEIQEFVKKQTNGLIDQNFELDPETVFALINTLYFKDIWDRELVYGLSTKDKIFTDINGKKSTREFLYGMYVQGQVQQTDKSYYFYTVTDNGYRVKFILPKDGFTLKEAMSADNLNKINKDSEFNVYDEKGVKHLTRCVFPSFKIGSDTPLMKIFKDNKLLPNAFSVYYSPLLQDKDMPIAVSQIIHKAVIDVNKDGIEGAAVTIIANAGSAAPEPEEYHDFVLDRSFGFIITDRSDVILFEGQVTQ